MRKIRKFKISLHFKEILRRLKSASVDLGAAGFPSESDLVGFISNLHQSIDTGVVYEFVEGNCLELSSVGIAHKDHFSICLITLGSEIEKQVSCLTNIGQITIANIALYEFLRTALNFVADLIKEEARKEDYEAQNMELLASPIFSYGVEPKFLREAIRLDNQAVKQALPALLNRLQADKIKVVFDGNILLPKASVVFIIPWLKKKGKKA